MAKQTKHTTAAAPAADNTNQAASAAPAPKGGFGQTTGNKDKFKRVMSGGKPMELAADKKKLPPQAQVIVNAIASHGEEGVTREELVKELPAAGLVTRQPAGRILSYYQKLITVESGLCTIEKDAPASAAA